MPPRTRRRALPSARMFWRMLIGACNPMACRAPVFRSSLVLGTQRRSHFPSTQSFGQLVCDRLSELGSPRPRLSPDPQCALLSVHSSGTARLPAVKQQLSVDVSDGRVMWMSIGLKKASSAPAGARLPDDGFGGKKERYQTIETPGTSTARRSAPRPPTATSQPARRRSTSADGGRWPYANSAMVPIGVSMTQPVPTVRLTSFDSNSPAVEFGARDPDAAVALQKLNTTPEEPPEERFPTDTVPLLQQVTRRDPSRQGTTNPTGPTGPGSTGPVGAPVDGLKPRSDGMMLPVHLSTAAGAARLARSPPYVQPQPPSRGSKASVSSTVSKDSQI